MKNKELQTDYLSRVKDIQLSEDMFNPINLTNHYWTEDKLNVCKLVLKSVPKVKSYDRVKKWMNIQACKKKVELYYIPKLGPNEKKKHYLKRKAQLNQNY